MRSLNINYTAIRADAVSAFLHDRYGVEGTLRALPAEKDQLMQVSSSCGRQFLLKIANPAERVAEAMLQINVLLHLENTDPSLPVQRVVRTLAGESMCRFKDPTGGEARNVRLYSYLDGELLRHRRGDASQARALGAAWALLGKALASFSDDGIFHESIWDLQRLATTEALIADIGDVHHRALLRLAFERFEGHVGPTLQDLRSQAIHNDFSGDNILIDPQSTDRLAGVLDFGDLVHSQLINDVAVGATDYLSAEDPDMQASVAFVSGYVSEVALSEGERSILFDLITSRLYLRIAIAEWRAKRFPENKDYLLRNTQRLWPQLERLLAKDVGAARECFLTAGDR